MRIDSSYSKFDGTMERIDKDRLKLILRNGNNYLAMAVAFIIMMLLYPDDAKFKYNYKKGSAWMYETLDAPIDFPLLKSKAELDLERAEAAKNMVPYYTSADDAVNASISSVLQACYADSIPEPLQEVLMKSLKKVYYVGLLPQKEQQDRTIFVRKGGTTLQTIESDLYTPSRAILQIKTDMMIAFPNQEESIEAIMNGLNISTLLIPNIEYDEKRTAELHHQAVDYISPTKGMVYADHRIVAEGEIVTEDIYNVLESFKAEFKRSVGYSNHKIFLYLGHAILIIAIFILLYIALYFSDFQILRHQNKFNFVLFICCLNFVLTVLVRKLHPDYLYIVPFAVTTLYMSSFIYNRVVLPVYFISLIPLALIAENGIELYLLNGVAGALAFITFSLYERGWLQFLNSIYIFIATAVVHLAFTLIFNNAEVSSDLIIYLYLFISAILVVVTYPFVFLMEKMFYMVSISSLKDLSDTENDVLRALAEKAPGTFQHVLQVANLAERAVVAIDGNPRIARAGALYHDIGKMVNPQAFIENQPKDFNYHKELSPKESAAIIISHVDDGLELAKKYHLPQIVQDFIASHHGHSMTEYFYNVYCNNGGDPNDKESFTYHGKLPVTKEEVVVMIADALEAASRSLAEYSEERIASLVDSVIERRIAGNQLVRANITFKDLTSLKSVFKRQIKEIYHSRIAYPKRDKK